MNRKSLIAVLCILSLAILAGCGSSDIYPVTPSPQATATPDCVGVPEDACDPASEQHEEASEAEKETLPEEDKDKPVEENINADDIEEDEQITEEAEEVDITQDEVGTSPEECETCQDEPASYPVIRTYDTTLPEGLEADLLYTDYQIAYDYVLILNTGVNIREEPTTRASVINTGVYGEKYSLIETVQGEYLEGYESDEWNMVTFKKDDEVKTGYIFAKLTEVRKFQFDKMYAELTKIKDQVDNNTTAYISNYKNYNGSAPRFNGGTDDDFGYRRSQSAAGYVEPNKESYFRYIPDGMLLNVLEETDDFYRVTPLSFGGEYWVEKKYVSFKNNIESLEQAVIVDRRYQNCATFEYRDGKWVMISYVFATTGANGEYKLPTPLGNYMMIQKRDRFLYYADGTTTIAGYAPYAIRFSGGGYIHGVPVQYIVRDDKKIDPGLQEYLHTIGTTPRSHMCVRNYTSHAKFLYDRMGLGKAGLFVIE